jgi:hypothetical protein
MANKVVHLTPLGAAQVLMILEDQYETQCAVVGKLEKGSNQIVIVEASEDGKKKQVKLSEFLAGKLEIDGQGNLNPK